MCDNCKNCNCGKLTNVQKVSVISEIIVSDAQHNLTDTNTLARIKGILDDEWKGY